MTFLQKSYGEWNKVEKVILIPMNYEESDGNEEVEMISTNNQNSHNNDNTVSNSESKDNAEENLFES